MSKTKILKIVKLIFSLLKTFRLICLKIIGATQNKILFLNEKQQEVTTLNFVLPDGATFTSKPSENHELKNGAWVENAEKKAQETQKLLNTKLQNWLDAIAVKRGYDNAQSCIAWASSDLLADKYSKECQKYKKYCIAFWLIVEKTPTNDFDQLMEKMPVFAWSE